MMGVGAFLRRLTRACPWVLGLAACAALAPVPGATPALAAEPCANEQRRLESKTNPATAQPYSTGLPECRAYEMVSPLYKQSHDAGPVASFGMPVAPDGETVGFASEGAFAEPENYRINILPANVYLSRRGPSGWITTSAFAPRNLVDGPSVVGLDSDLSPDLRSMQVSCGFSSPVNGEGSKGTGLECAKRESGGAWVSTPLYLGTDETSSQLEILGYIGASSDFSRVFVQPLLFHLLPEDTAPGVAGIYELEDLGAGPGHEHLRLVNVDNGGKEILTANSSGAEPLIAGGPLVGYAATKPPPEGSAYHAVSANGQTVFFTAAPTEPQIPTLYARVDNGQADAHTVTVSAPEGVTSEQKPAIFQGASEGPTDAHPERKLKVFFTTEQKLLKSDTDTANDLYEYDFSKPVGERLVQISAGEPNPEHPIKGAGANVRGVLRTSPDGSHVYFVATGVLTNAKNQEGKEAAKGQPNLYGYDTLTNETKFIATLSLADSELWGGPKVTGTQAGRDSKSREVQTTPDGRYLVFSSAVKLAGDTNIGAAYRYDFESGALTWISHAAPGFTKEKEEGQPVIITPLNNSKAGANLNIDDWNRAISENGEYVVFTTSEKLQAGAADGVTNVYLWHNGTVSMISPGASASDIAAMSSSGSDIFFATATALVGQDTDLLKDVYDARVGGGFPAPPAEPSC
jgi:hypothetical protein